MVFNIHDEKIEQVIAELRGFEKQKKIRQCISKKLF